MLHNYGLVVQGSNCLFKDRIWIKIVIRIALESCAYLYSVTMLHKNLTKFIFSNDGLTAHNRVFDNPYYHYHYYYQYKY